MLATTSYYDGDVNIHAIALAKALGQNNRKAAEAAYQAGLNQLSGEFIQLLRKKGIFRFSRYNFESSIITSLCKQTLDDIHTHLSIDSQQYLLSIISLGVAAPAVQRLFFRMRKTINARSFRSYFVTVDCLFREKHQHAEPQIRTSWQHFSKEELSDAFSYYCAILWQDRVPAISDLNTFNKSKIGTDYYREQLAEFARIIRFRDAEIMVEALPYIAVNTEDAIVISANTDDFERFTRWGYICGNFQNEADQLQLKLQEVPSIEEFAKTLAERELSQLFEVVDRPYKRIRLHLPRVTSFTQLFAGSNAFQEDHIFICQAAKSLYIELDQVYSERIFKSITLHDLIRFQRLFLFLTVAMQEYCRSRHLLGTEVYYNSLLPVFQREHVEVLIREFCGISKPEELIELLIADPAGVRVMDLLYTPIVPIADRYAMPTAVIGYGNATRNALQKSQFRFDADDRVDPVGNILAQAFADVGVAVRRNFKYHHGLLEGDVDVLAIVEGNVFAFECKNSLHPCNVYELRQSYGYLQKAFRQLSRFRDCVEDKAFRSTLGQAFELDLSAKPRVFTCVVMGNRMFSGLEVDGHCVRPAYEIQNVITGGAANFFIPKSIADLHGAKVHLRMDYWRAAQFHASDIIDYLQGESLHRIAAASLQDYTETVSFEGTELRFKSFALNFGVFTEQLRRHPGIRVVDQQVANDHVADSLGA